MKGRQHRSLGLGSWPIHWPLRRARSIAAGLAIGLVAVVSGAPGRSGIATARADSPGEPPPLWHDRSPHTVRFVTVPGGVRLEVLDWGGTGEPLVFLAGLDNTAHLFDEFAPQFTDRFHVLAITRRGWGASDHPESGYTIAILVGDIRAALDSLHLGRVDLVGHSVAGQELTWMAAEYPTRVDRLVYLDAGFDYHAHPVPGFLPAMPLPTAADLSSPAAGLAYVRRINVAPIPEADFRATERFDSTGRDLGPLTSQGPGGEVIRAATEKAPPLARVRAPTLAIYDWPITSAEFLPFMSPTDSTAMRWLRVAQAWHRAQRDEFKAKVRQAQIVELAGASHYVFLTQPDSVAQAMRRFLSAGD